MKVLIEGSQEEFDEKRPELIKALAGKKFKVEVRPAIERKATDARPSFHEAQADIQAYWDKKFKQTLIAIEEDVNEIIR